MEKPIVGVNYKSKYSGEFEGKTYNYFTDIELNIGDVVEAPTGNGDSIAIVTEINVSKEKVSPRILPLLKTITSFAESEMNSMSKDLIIVKQLPVIEDQLKQVKEHIEERVATALSLVVNEDTYKEVKRVRAALSKEYKELEDKRKEVKKVILAPYLKFEDLYKTCAGDIYTHADAKLKKRIDEVENGIKSEKEKEIQEYFKEYQVSKNIDFVKFEDAEINITMSASKKSLKEKAASFLDRIEEDLGLIETQEHKEEILVEYKKSLNAAQAITGVTTRKEAIEKERQRREARRAERENAAKAREKVENLIEPEPKPESEKAPESIQAPISVPTETVVAPSTDEPVYSTSFSVTGTIAQLKALKQFLVEGGYKYEQL